MWLTTFFDKKCTIYEVWYAIVDATQVPSKNVIHNLIPCDFGKGITPENYVPDLQVTKESDKETMEIVLNWPWFIDVRKWMLIELFEDAWWVDVSVWIYKINTVDFVKDMYWVLDNIYMSATTTDGDY